MSRRLLREGGRFLLCRTGGLRGLYSPNTLSLHFKQELKPWAPYLLGVSLLNCLMKRARSSRGLNPLLIKSAVSCLRSVAKSLNRWQV